MRVSTTVFRAGSRPAAALKGDRPDRAKDPMGVRRVVWVARRGTCVAPRGVRVGGRRQRAARRLAARARRPRSSRRRLRPRHAVSAAAAAAATLYIHFR